MYEFVKKRVGVVLGSAIALFGFTVPAQAVIELAEPYGSSAKIAAIIACALFAVTFVLQRMARSPSVRSNSVVVQIAGISIISMLLAVVATLGLAAVGLLKTLV